MKPFKLPAHLREYNPGLDLSQPATVKAPPKYGNHQMTAHGEKWDSQREAEVYGELLLRQAAGQISDLQPHPRYPLEAHGMVLGAYEADASYFDLIAGTPVVVDVKSQPTRTALYRWKKRHFEAQYAPLTITEIE